MTAPRSATRSPDIGTLGHRSRLGENVAKIVGLFVDPPRYEPRVEEDKPFYPVVRNPAVPPRIVDLHRHFTQEHMYRVRCEVWVDRHRNVYRIYKDPDVHGPLHAVARQLRGIL